MKRVDGSRSTQSLPVCSPVGIEPLENRVLLAADGPRIICLATDNRGQAVIDFDQAVNTTTITRKSAAIITAGADAKFNTADDVRAISTRTYRKGKLTLTANLPANTYYRVFLDGNAIKGTNGLFMDGSFNGAGVITGNGRQGGSFDVTTVWPARTIARFSTVAGIMDVRLWGKNAPATVTNFLSYANKAAWDTSFFHRLEATPLHVLQGGGFSITPAGGIDTIATDAPIVKENGLSNVRGTVAMARTSELNSATDQWFFNTQGNTDLDTLNGGYCAFGTVYGTRSLAVMDALAAYHVVDASGGSSGSPFGELPVRDWTSGSIDPQKNLLNITRVAILMDVQATRAFTPSMRAAAAPAAPVAPVAPAAAPFSSVPVASSTTWLSPDKALW